LNSIIVIALNGDGWHSVPALKDRVFLSDYDPSYLAERNHSPVFSRKSHIEQLCGVETIRSRGTRHHIDRANILPHLRYGHASCEELNLLTDIFRRQADQPKPILI
jgi:hypothetical protein